MVIAVCSGITFADDAPDAKTAAKSPLDRLRLRSAFDRWDELKQRLNPITTRTKKAETREPVLMAVPVIRPAGVPMVEDTAHAPLEAAPAPVLAAQKPVPDVVTISHQPIDRQPMIESDDPLTHSETAIGTIQPYFDYEPLRVARQESDCETICPCPDGSDCKKPGGTKPCPCPESFIKQPWIVETYTPRNFVEEPKNWDASDVFSNPLYFEDFTLERYGHTYCYGLQPVVSVTRFSGQLALLPYQMAFKPIRQKRYPLGHYRPGEWAPKLLYQIPLNAKATLVQAGVVTGSLLIFP